MVMGLQTLPNVLKLTPADERAHAMDLCVALLRMVSVRAARTNGVTFSSLHRIQRHVYVVSSAQAQSVGTLVRVVKVVLLS